MCALIAILALLYMIPAHAEAMRVHLGGEVKPLKGAIAFCEQTPERCKASPDSQVAFNAVRFAELELVNFIVNAEITFQAEPPHADVWQDRDFTAGDCEDLALLKRRELIKLGWPKGALRIAIVRRKADDSELHALLVASTSVGDYVLDIQDKEYGVVRSWNPREFSELRMIWGADAKWYALLPEPTVTAGVE